MGTVVAKDQEIFSAVRMKQEILHDLVGSSKHSAASMLKRSGSETEHLERTMLQILSSRQETLIAKENSFVHVSCASLFGGDSPYEELRTSLQSLLSSF